MHKPESFPERVGPWRIVREIGQGGMGAVYLAERDEHFQQRVALKLIRRGLHGETHLVRRFLEERQILASFQHANIAHVLDGGVTDDGMPWFAMEFVEGEPVDQWCDSRRLSIEARLELFATVCSAVEYAHGKQIIHRDIKPSNILVRADGVAKLLDFGVAKLLAEDRSDSTRTGFRMLTPEYASPEQIRGEDVSPASDVYSLGVLLYELLTGKRPYRTTGRARVELEQAILTQEPSRPSTAVRAESASGRTAETLTQAARARSTTPEGLSEALRGELDGIVLKALTKEPQRRYASVGAFAQDVRRYLDGIPVSTRPPRPILKRVAILGAAIGVIFVGATIFGGPLWRRAVTATDAAAPVLAVGLITDFRGNNSEPARFLADMLATNLARVPSLRVISTARLYELMAETGPSTETNAGAYASAARRAGAAMLLDGGLHSIKGDSIRLDLRQIDVATGSVLNGYSIKGNSVFALVDSATSQLSDRLGVRTVLGSIADVTTGSEVAYRFYEAGLRAFYQGDLPAARGLLEAALAEDSTLAMAAYYLSQADRARSAEYRARAVRLATQASERERLIIQSEWYLNRADAIGIAKAETLAIRYPQEVTGHFLAGRALIGTGDFAGAIRSLRNVIVMDSSALAGTANPCTRCEARYSLIEAYLALDSLNAAEREARVWTSIQPRSSTAWQVMSEVLILLGRREDALAAYRQAATIDPGLDNRPPFVFMYHMAAQEFAILDARLREMMNAAVSSTRAEASLYLLHSLRSQGRFTEALELARGYRALISEQRPGAPSATFAPLEAQALFELGRYRQAAALSDTIATLPVGQTAAQIAGNRVTALVRVATAVAAVNDTARLAILVDTIRALGAMSMWARDQKAHHFVRGLLLERRRLHEQALAEFRSSAISPVGNAPAQFHVALNLLQLGRAREAIAVLVPLQRARIISVISGTTPTQLRELLAQAYDAAGQRDSALRQYRAVLHALQQADPFMREHVASMRARVTAMETAPNRRTP